MLSEEILQALRAYAAKMQNAITLVVQVGEHPKRAELVDFLSDVASTGDLLHLEERDTIGVLRSPISFLLEKEGVDTGIRFSGIPSGHEFNSLILALLQSSGTEIKLDDGLKNIIAGIQVPMHFEVFVSLSCHNCPDVVQAVNQFALLNSNISTEMLDGGLFQDIIEARDIQGVPSVYLNGELFANGKVSPSDLVEKLMQQAPAIHQLETSALPLQDVTVVGGGPAGVGAAIYSARKGLKVTLVADRLGGQVKDTMGIENLISVPSTTGPELVAAMQSHMSDYDITVKEHLKVSKVVGGEIKTIVLSSGEEIHSKTLIIATGAKWRELGVPGEKENVGNGVAYCPHCDGPFFKDKDIAVIGGGNSGIEAALDLAGIVNTVTVFEFLPELKADQVLIDQLQKRANIAVLKNVATDAIEAADGKVTAIDYTERESGETHKKALDGVFVQIGLVPNSEFLDGVVELSAHKEIVIDERCQTSEPGIYACGDVTTVPYKQIVISMGEGAKASLTAFDYLLKNGEHLENTYNVEYLDAKALA